MYGVSGPDGFGFESLRLFDPAGAFTWQSNGSSVAVAVFDLIARDGPHFDSHGISNVRETLAVCARHGFQFTDSQRLHAVQNRTARTRSGRT